MNALTAIPGFSGADRRDLGIAAVDEAESRAWQDRADEAIEKLASSGAYFTADDVRELAGDPRHANAMGARLRAAARKRIITAEGTDQSIRPEGHSRILRVWRAA